MKRLRVISILMLIIISMTGVCGCMDQTKLYGTKNRDQDDTEYSQMMLDYIENKYEKDFQIIDSIFPEEGFNLDHLHNVLIVKEVQSGVITNVYATLGSPYTFYDDFVSDFASWSNRHLVSTTELDGIGTGKLYFYLRNEDLDLLDVSSSNVSRVVFVANINQKPDSDVLQKLYQIYNELYALDYEYIFMDIGFTENNTVFDDYVESYRVFSDKSWEDYSGKVYATLSTRQEGLTFDAFKDLCEYK